MKIIGKQGKIQLTGGMLVRAALSILIAIALMPAVPLAAYADEAVEPELVQPVAETTEIAAAPAAEEVQEEATPEPEPEVQAVPEVVETVPDAPHAEEVKERLALKSISEDRLAAFGGKEKLTDDLERFLEAKSISAATATFTDFKVDDATAMAIFKLDDAAWTKISLAYTGGAYSFTALDPSALEVFEQETVELQKCEKTPRPLFTFDQILF